LPGAGCGIGFKLTGFTRLCSGEGITQAGALTSRDLERFLASEQARGISDNSVRTAAQVLKTFCRFAHRRGEMPDIITGHFEMPKATDVLIETFTDEQLAALMGAPSSKSWYGVRDRAIMHALRHHGPAIGSRRVAS
jgi:site-specific recombinase XerD